MNSPQRALATMHAAHGTTPGQTCGDCVSLVQVGSRPHPTSGGRLAEMGCRIYRLDHEVKTRWAKTWPACGKFQSIG